jgi:predicted phage terminase large subunit-like protein
VARSPPWFRAEHLPGSRRVVWPGGVEALQRSASEPDQIRSMNVTFTWADEVASWGPNLEASWINIEAATRVGPLNTKILATTTPRALPWLKALIVRSDVRHICRPTRDNERNLAPGVVQALYARFAGAVAAQELEGQIVDISAESWFPNADAPIIAAPPDDIVAVARGWDLAATAPSDANADPDWTFGVKLGRRKSGRLVVLHAVGIRARAAAVEDLIKRTAEQDGRSCTIVLPMDPGQAGKSQVADLTAKLFGFVVRSERPSGSKQTRAQSLASQWQHGNVDVVRGGWNDAFFEQMAGFPNAWCHDDAVDASATACNHLAAHRSMRDVPQWGDGTALKALRAQQEKAKNQ